MKLNKAVQSIKAQIMHKWDTDLAETKALIAYFVAENGHFSTT